MELGDGRVIRSAEVVGEARSGCSVCVIQDCPDCRSCFEVAKGCEVLIHEATLDEKHKMAVPHGHSTAKMAAASAVQAKLLLLTPRG